MVKTNKSAGHQKSHGILTKYYDEMGKNDLTIRTNDRSRGNGNEGKVKGEKKKTKCHR